MNGDTMLEVAATRSMKVVDLKKQVTKNDGTPWKEQKLLLSGTELGDSALLGEVLPADAQVDLQWVRAKNINGVWGDMVANKLDAVAPDHMADAVVRRIDKEDQD